MLYLRYVFIFVLRNNYTGRDYHPGPVHRSPLVVIIIVIIVVVVIGDQWSFVVVCDISTRSDIIGTPFSHHHPFHPQLEPGTRCVVRGRLLFLSRACATKYSAGPSRRWMMTMTMIIPRWWYTRRKAVCNDIAAYRIVFCTLHARLARYAII